MKSVVSSDNPDKSFFGLDIAAAKSPRFLVVLGVFSMIAGFIVTTGFKDAYLGLLIWLLTSDNGRLVLPSQTPFTPLMLHWKVWFICFSFVFIPMVAATLTLRTTTQRLWIAVGIFLVSIASAAAIFSLYRVYLQQKITVAIVAEGTVSKLITVPRAEVTQFLDVPIISLSVGASVLIAIAYIFIAMRSMPRGPHAHVGNARGR
ncbi:hypothetical protein [Herbaspirillum rhizosphaerae]|uniref:hypothetical protein n=1 Tax=Herbaspirillum rhizosphaerae TaxID=346179 RepID=UPI00067BBD13|nr:hypothetical protein [Herbaspirillum rhizosphaerae]